MGWYAGDAARMERAVHPDLAKRIVRESRAGGRQFQHATAAELVDDTRAGGGRDAPSAERCAGVTVLDIFGNAASVRIDAGAWVDYLHMARWDTSWQIANVLWAVRQERHAPKRTRF